MKHSEHLLSRRGVALVMFFSVAGAFAVAFLESLHLCYWSDDRYAVSPLSAEFLAFDFVAALVFGTLVAVIAIAFGTIAFRHTRLRQIADRRVLSGIAAAYVIMAAYLWFFTSADTGSCRFDM